MTRPSMTGTALAEPEPSGLFATVLRWAVLVLVATLCVGASACGESPVDLPGARIAEPRTASTTAPSDDRAGSRPSLPVTVESNDGRTVTVTDVSRIVPLQGNISEIVFDLGLGESVVARDISATFAEAADLPLVTRAHDVSAESVLSLRPTVVLVDEDTGPPEAIDHIRSVGIPVVEFPRPESLDDIAPRIRAVAAALGVPAAGEALVERTEADLESVAPPAGAVGPVVAFLYVRGSAGVYLIAGPGSGVDAMVAAAGGTDAGTEMGLENPFTPITSEALAKTAPDVILVTTSGLESVGGVDGLVQIPGVAQTPAGRAKRIVAMDDGLLFSFGSRTPDAVARLAADLRNAWRR